MLSIVLIMATILAALTTSNSNLDAEAATTGSITDSKLVGGLASPTTMEFSPDGRIFVAEKDGNLKIIKNGALLTTPFLSLTVDSTGERGLLGFAFDPNFSSNKYLYVYYTATSPTIHNRVSRFAADPANPDKVLAGSEFPILDLETLGGAWHNGGAIHFGGDGKLYVGVGDNGVSSNSQSLLTRLGKILRINPDGTIPTDNPFYNTLGAKKEIWALGLRNPFTFAFSQSTSASPQKMYINDVGQDSWEEIDEGIAGANYGWPLCEGTCIIPAYVNPVYTYPHNGAGKAIAGGAFYEANQFPSEYLGSYFFGDYVAGFIKRLTPDGQVIDFLSGLSAPTDIKIGPNDGFLYYLLIGTGEVHKVQYVAATMNHDPVAIASASPTSGPAPPLAVNFDASASKDSDIGDVLSYSWDFGDGTPKASGVKVTHTYASSGSFVATLTVSDGKGGMGSTTTNIAVGGPPVGMIDNPPIGTKYNAGDKISFSGSASDPEDGRLPASAFKWVVLLHHNTHTHPFMEFNGVTNGNFTIPTVSETDSDVWYRIYLTVTDSSGLSQTTTRDILPNKVTVTIDTSKPGLQINLDGQPHTSPYTFVGVVGIIRNLDVPSQQSLDGQAYQFQYWSDGGASSHTISTPSTNATYTAGYSILTPSLDSFDLTVNALDTDGGVRHMWTTIWSGNSSSVGTVLQQGFTSMNFTGNAGSTYSLTVANYKNRIFDHWLDDNSTSSTRVITLNSNSALTAIYKLLPPTFNLTIKSVDQSGNEINEMYTTVSSEDMMMLKSGFTPLVFTGDTGSPYAVAAEDYGNFIFNHWDNGSTDRIRNITSIGDTTIIAYYIMN